MRALLKRASRGETDAYLGLADVYFNLVTEYLYLCNLDEGETIQKAELLLREGWMRLPYLKRLSDWERFLARSLMAVEPKRPVPVEDNSRKRLVELDPHAKFALVAFELENWGYKWLTRALRLEPRELARLLFRTRCQLIGRKPDQSGRKLRLFLEQVSVDLDGQLPPRQRRNFLRKLCSCDEAKAFKSQWLDYRCQLIEVRQQVRLQPETRDSVLVRIAASLSLEEMLRPPLLRRIRILFASAELSAEEVLPRTRELVRGRG